MRYAELKESAWKRYRGDARPCLIASAKTLNGRDRILLDVTASWGIIETGRTEVFFGYYVRISGPAGEDWYGEDRISMKKALEAAAMAVAYSGWDLIAAGLFTNWVESGLSWNSGFGHWDGESSVHMLDLPPD